MDIDRCSEDLVGELLMLEDHTSLSSSEPD